MLKAILSSFVLIGGTQVTWRFVYRNMGQDMTSNFENGGLEALNSHDAYATMYLLTTVVSILISVYFLYKGFSKEMLKKSATSALVLFCLFGMTGCIRPFAPVKLEVIGTNEEAFLIPLLDATGKQVTTHSEELLEKNLVQTQQVKIPQQWVPKGYEYIGANGVWQDAAVLIKVDKSPVTCEWTADTATGTSDKNEAVWVMTADQVEFSTGWTCTARIATREDAIKFLHNYPNGSIKAVMDREVRAKLQTSFGLEVTDLPMVQLRKAATPHILNTVKDVTTFFAERGLTITNLGISGGFVYKDKKVGDKLVELFNAEQEEAISLSRANAKKADADGEANAVKSKALGEAEAIRSVADAKAYEIEMANKDLKTYLELKRLEIDRERVEKWNGTYPHFLMTGGESPNLLMTMPEINK